MLNNSYQAGGGCRSAVVNLLIGIVVILGVVGIAAAGLENSTKIDRAQEYAHQETMAKIPDTLEERQVDALESVAVTGFATNLAIAASGDASQSSMAWANAATIIGFALILLAVALIVATLTRKSSEYHPPASAGIPIDVPTYIRNERR